MHTFVSERTIYHAGFYKISRKELVVLFCFVLEIEVQKVVFREIEGGAIFWEVLAVCLL
jgi:hypothetical protein